jgi:N-acetylmuramoyl-L-alanine amidase
MRHINEVIVHCAATPEGKDFTVADIDRWHKKRGWSGIGYHYVVYRDGSVHKGRPVSKIGAHVRGRNRNTIGVCYIGGVAKNGRTAKDTRTSAQKAALVKLLLGLKDEFPTIKKISGHNQYAAKACPSFNANSEYKALLRDKKPLVKSRTMQGAGIATVGGTTALVEPVKELTNKLSDQQAQLASGDFITVAIGAAIVLGAMYALYARWDDAGRPKFWG